MAQEITLPVKLQLENLQSVVKEMRSQLNNFKVDSSSYRKLSANIIDIEKRIEQLQVQASRPFINTKQFTDVEKSIIKIEDDITKMRLNANQIKFGDLSLNTTQKNELQAFNNQIKQTEDAIKNIKQTAKESFLATDIGKAWAIDNPQAATQSITQITNTITQEVGKQKTALDEAKKQLEDYRALQNANTNLNKFMKAHHELSEETMGKELYHKIFNANNDFKAGGKTLLMNWLETQFQLDHNVVANLVNDTGKNVKRAFSEVTGNVHDALKKEQIRINNTAKEEKTTTNKGATLSAAVTEQNAVYNAKLQVQDALVRSNMLVGKSEEELRRQLEENKEALEMWKQAQVSAAQNNSVLSAAFSKASTSLTQLQSAVDAGKQKLVSLDQATNKLSGISNFVNRYVGAYAIIRKVSTAIRNAFNNIKELDKVITSIAVVTNMSQEDLWNKVGQYTQMAQQYGVATKDVYEVSQIFYQQGLQTSQVMDMTTESLKMAKIAGIDYSTAANAMTVAVRAFKIDMEEAQQVTDAYSALAAKFAVSSAEIANAMEKTASSAASVGMSVQSTSAFISVMEQTTRESAQNIGSALKSIISRYGEMKASPSTLLNVDGEEVAFNKVDTALKSIGISIKDASGQFRDFDDVIMELAAKWNTLDNNTQRYIATVMAGNRQQSRFIALVSNYDELSRAMNVASNAENASIVQVAKTMDSLESKTNQLKNAFSQLYLDLHIESGLKGIYDWLTRIITTIGKLGTLTGAIPTLLNIFGFGTGLKSTIKSIQDGIQQKKIQVEANISDYQDKMNIVKADFEKEYNLNIRTNVDDTALQTTKNEIIGLQAEALATDMVNINNRLDKSVLIDDLLYNKSKLSNTDETKHFLEDRGFDDTEIAQLQSKVEAFGQSLETTSNKIQSLGESAEQTADTTKRESEAKQQSAVVEQEKSLQAQRAGQADADKVPPAKAAAAADEEKAKAGRKVGGGSGWSNHPLAMKLTGIGAGAARMIGTAITATGASIQDKSTDINERSKIWTGIGNGISMAGTGASMLMSLGPWGAAAGAIGGLLLGGLGAFIDGINMTLQERISLAQSEAKAAEDESLKKQARSIDLSSQIDNLKNLEKVMYNSTDDMQAYTDAMNSLADQYPELVSQYDSAGNAIITITDAEETLSQARLDGANAAHAAALEQLRVAKLQLDTFKQYSTDSEEYNKRQELEDYITFVSGKSNKQISEEVSAIINGELKSPLSQQITFNLQQISSSYGLLDDQEFKLGEKISDNPLLNFESTYIKPIKAWFTDNKDALNLTQTFEDVTGHVEGQDYTIAQLQRALDFIKGQEAKWKKQVELLNQITNSTTGYAELLFQLKNDSTISQTQQSQLEITKNYQGLFNQMMLQAFNKENKGRENKYQNLDEWKTAEDSNYLIVVDEIYNNFTKWYKNLYNLADEFAKLDFTEYATADEIIEKFHIPLENQEALIEQFKIANIANKDRILNAIYNENRTGINEDLKGLDKIGNYEKELGPRRHIFGNFAVDIANLFAGNTTEIIFKYADYFTTQLLDINKLAEQGYTQLASNRLDILHSFAETLASTDSNVQRNLFGILTSIDFSDYDSLVSTYESLDAYNKKNGETTEVNNILSLLEQAQNDLLFNVHTLVQSLGDKISNAAKDIDGILGTNKSGLDLSGALKQLESLNANKVSEDILQFDSIFTFDATLGKYVYTVKGLEASIEQAEGNFKVEQTKLNRMKQLYDRELTYHVSNVNYEADKPQDAVEKLKANISGYNTFDKETQNLFEDLANDFFNDKTIEQHDLSAWKKFIEDRKTQNDKDIIAVEKIIAAYKNNKPNQLFQNIDWASLALGTDYFDTNKTLVDKLAEELNLTAVYTTEQVLDEYLKTIKDPQARAVAKEKIDNSIIQEKTSQYQNAISELLNASANTVFSQATWQAANRLDIIIEQDVKTKSEEAIFTASLFLQSLADSIGKAGYTLEQYNQDAKSILDKTLNIKTRGKALLDFASGTIDSNALESLANSLGVQLTDLVNIRSGQMKEEFAAYLKFDDITGTYKIQGSFNDFIDALNKKYGDIIDKSSKTYRDALNSFNENAIKEKNELSDMITKELQSFSSANIGDTLNISGIYSALVASKGVNQNYIDLLALRFKSLGATFADGLLTLEKEAKIPELIREMMAIISEKKLLLKDEIAALGDVLIEYLKSINEIIKKGIEGVLSNAEANQLQEFGEAYGLKLDFSKTANGLKLSQKSAIDLYQTVSKIDAMAGRTTFKNLMDSMTATNEKYATVSSTLTRIQELSKLIYDADQKVSTARLEEYQAELAVAKEILAVRSTQEDASFDFMNQDIPGVLKNPQKYWESWDKAYQTVQDAFDPKKNAGKEGMIKYEDWYNMASELGRVAALTGEKFTVAGMEIDGSLEKTSALIQKGIDTMVDVDGEGLMVHLPSIGIDMAEAAGSLADNMDKGKKAVAKAEIAAIDAAIQVLEMIVAMDSIGDVDADQDMTIELPEIGVAYDEKGFESNFFSSFSTAFTDWQNGLNTFLNTAGNEEKKAAFDAVKAYGHSMTELLTATPAKLKEWGIDKNMYRSLIQGIYDLVTSNDFEALGDQESIIGKLNELLADAFGDMELTVDLGNIHTSFKGGRIQQIDWNSEASKKVLNDAFGEIDHDEQVKQAQALFDKTQGNQVLTIEEHQQLKILLGEVTVVTDETGKKTYRTKDGEIYDSLEAAVAAADLVNTGAKGRATIQGEGETVTATNTITIGDKEITVKSDGKGNVEYIYNKQKYTDATQLYDAIFENVSKENSFWGDMSNSFGKKEAQQLWEASVGISFEPSFTIVDQQMYDRQGHDALVKLKNSIQSAQTAGQWKEVIEQAGEMGITLTPKFDEKGKITAESYQEIMKMFDAEQITSQVTDAIKAAMTGGAGEEIGHAISDGLQAQLTSNEEGLVLDIPKVTLNAQEIAVDVEGKTPDLEGTLGSTEAEALAVDIKQLYAYFNGEPNADGIYLDDLSYPELYAIISTIYALYNKAPNAEMVSLDQIPYETLDAIVKTVHAIFSGVPLSSDTVWLDEINYPLLQAAIETLKANYKGKPNDTTGIKLDSIDYNTLFTVTLLNVVAQTSGTTDIPVQLGENQAKVTHIVNALLTGGLKLNGNGVTIEEGTITVAEGQTIPIPEGTNIGGIISALVAEGTNVAVTKGALTIDPEAHIDMDLLTAIFAALDFTLSPEATAQAESGPTTSELGIQSIYTSDKAIEFIQDVKLKYNVETDEDAASIMNTRSFLYNNTDRRSGELKASSWDFDATYGLRNDGSKWMDQGLVYKHYTPEKWTQYPGLATDSTLDNGWYIEENSAIATYINSLQSMVAQGKKLGAVDFSNLEALKELEIKGETGQQIEQIYEAANTNATDFESNLNSVKEFLEGNIDVSSLESVASALESIAAAVTDLAGAPWSNIAAGINALNAPSEQTTQQPSAKKISEPQQTVDTTSTNSSIAQTNTEISTMTESVNTASDGFRELGSKAAQAGDDANTFAEGVSEAGDSAQEAGNKANDAAGNINNEAGASSNAGGAASSAASAIQDLANAIINIPAKTDHEVDIKVTVTSSEAKGTSISVSGDGSHKLFSFAKGSARAGGKSTLMGELGPELVVSGGSYYVVGQGGAEFVDLAPDAIVFNHKQTASLLGSGKSSRGKPITNETNAISWAKGSINGGPAKASASAALAMLKQLRAMWSRLADMSVKDFASKAGSGGGGGGSGNNGKFIKDLEQWYNWLQQIAQLEKDITLEEKKREVYQSSMVARGKEYFQSQEKTLSYLKQQTKVQKELTDKQQEYFDTRIKEMNAKSNPFTALYTFNKDGQLQYGKGALEKLSVISGRDNTGKPNKTVQQQYEAIIAMNPEFAKFMQYDSSGGQIEFEKGKPKDEAAYAAAVQAFWDKIEADRQEMQGLHDSIEDGKQSLLELENQRNEILQEIKDNQMSLENDVLKAIEDREKRTIDELSKQKDAFKDANQNLIDGLSNALNKERQMYDSQQNEYDLEQRRRRLSILQRSGGSAAEISNLQKEIDDSSREVYFTKQQEQIDAIQEAADNQIAKLEEQIDIMNESLAYQKEHGLLWNEVYEWMQLGPEKLVDKITQNDKSYWEKSPTAFAEAQKEVLFKAQQWQAYVDSELDVQNAASTIADTITSEAPAETTVNDTDTTVNDTGTGENNVNTSAATNTQQTLKIKPEFTKEEKRAIEREIEKAKRAGEAKYAAAKEAAMAANKSKGNGIVAFDRGGMIDKDQYAFVHADEAVLTPDQAHFLRNDLLGKQPNSFKNIVEKFYSQLAGFEYLSSSSYAEGTVIIEHAEVNMKVNKLANNYDAAKAGQDVMQEILNIARKTQAQNRVGR